MTEIRTVPAFRFGLVGRLRWVGYRRGAALPAVAYLPSPDADPRLTTDTRRALPLQVVVVAIPLPDCTFAGQDGTVALPTQLPAGRFQMPYVRWATFKLQQQPQVGLSVMSGIDRLS